MPTQRIELQFITHACVMLCAGDVRLLCDPWLSGTAFDDGWRLMVEPETRIIDCSPTHIWISHEHPDHFSPRDLLQIPEMERASITVLYQATQDGKVKDFLKGKGFTVRVLPPMEAVSLSPDVTVRCGSIASDSWLAFHAYEQTVLNLNDCITGQDILVDNPDDLPRAEIDELRRWADAPDVLLTQFSYSNWVGNPEDRHLHRLQAKTKLNQVRQQIRGLRPQAVLPFASYVCFCHEENAYLNEEANTVLDVSEVIEDEGAYSLVLSPGESWAIGSYHNSSTALNTWSKIYADMANSTLEKSVPVSLDALRIAFNDYQQRVRDRNDWSAIARFAETGGLAPSTIYLWDHDLCLSLDLTTSLSPCELGAENADISMGSSALAYILKYDWGRGTLLVNGRFSADYQGIHRFLAQTQIAYGNNVGLRFPETLTEDVLRDSPSYVAFFSRQALRLGREEN